MSFYLVLGVLGFASLRSVQCHEVVVILKNSGDFEELKRVLDDNGHDSAWTVKKDVTIAGTQIKQGSTLLAKGAMKGATELSEITLLDVKRKPAELRFLQEKRFDPSAQKSEKDSSWQVSSGRSCHGAETSWQVCPNLESCDHCERLDCKFTPWIEWSSPRGCLGLCERHRNIEQNANACPGAIICEGNLAETKECPSKCRGERRDCLLSPWTEFSGCSKHQKNRERSVKVEQANGGDLCTGELSETVACGDVEKPQDCAVSDWNHWTGCSVKKNCGGGHRTRMRRVIHHAKKGGKACDQVLMTTEECNTQPCVFEPCKVGQWEDWSGCGRDPTPQLMMRVRQVTPWKCKAESGADVIIKEVAGCPSGDKPVNCLFSAWSSWEECDRTCDGGQSYRTRLIKVHASHGGTCILKTTEETKPCNTKLCIPKSEDDCRLEAWGGWGDCKPACGPGQSSRKRHMTPATSGAGRGCVGELEETKQCESGVCKVQNCEWDNWSEWSACDCTCGGGSKTRDRTVQKAPRNGGTLCDNKTKSERGACNTVSCLPAARNGSWGKWTTWNDCSSICGDGLQKRSRHIDTPNTWLGHSVEGLSDEFKSCKLEDCKGDKDCKLSDWDPWSSCSCSCNGLRERHRRVEQYKVGNGKQCEDRLDLKAIEPCNPGPNKTMNPRCFHDIPVDCKMTSWNEWTECDATCGSGQKQRSRSISNPSQFGGDGCLGCLAEVATCKKEKCPPFCVPKPCVWGDWSSWSACLKCGMMRNRHRAIEHHASPCGKQCDPGHARELMACPTSCYHPTYCHWTEWKVGECMVSCGHGSTVRTRQLEWKDEKDAADAWAANSSNYLFKVWNGQRAEGNKLVETTCEGHQSNYSDCFLKTCSTCERVDGKWASWSDWHGGDHDCTGLCERHRVVEVRNSQCGTPCSGASHMTKDCSEKLYNDKSSCRAEKNCTWNDWAIWSHCTHFSSQKNRVRTHSAASGGGLSCHGNTRETQPCSSSFPISDSKVSDWAEWSACSETCGTGVQQRKRRIQAEASGGGEAFKGDLIQMEACQKPECAECPAKNCVLDDWNGWSDCNATVSQQHRERSIKVNPECGGTSCEGPLKASQICHLADASCVLSDWTKWDDCDRSCDGGQQHRHRQIHHPPIGTGDCTRDLIQTQPCNTQLCHADASCKWDKWSQWKCEVTCGDGQQFRTRGIEHHASTGSGCDGQDKETKSCGKLKTCEGIQDCKWGEWLAWSDCTCDCGGGTQTRDRHIEVSPRLSGDLCAPHAKHEIQACHTQSCDSSCTDGLWTDWAEWGTCTSSCEGGVSVRHRMIKVEPSDCGKPAIGLSQEYEWCNEKVSCTADVDCAFNTWTDWSDCSCSCDGMKRRSRNIKAHGRGNGKHCPPDGGVAAEQVIEPCNTQKCDSAEPPVDCVFAAWTKWTDCSAPCGPGEHRRQRVIDTPPSNGGDQCNGTLAEVGECLQKACEGTPTPVQCQWGKWSEWDACTHCSGQRFRHRHVARSAEYGGDACEKGNARETKACPRQCHKPTFCSWENWGPWDSCAGKCGFAKQSRKRKLAVLTTAPHADPSLLMQVAELKDKGRRDELQRTQDMVVAFAGGALSLIAALGAARIFRAARGGSRTPGIRGGSADPYGAGIEANDNHGASQHFFFSETASYAPPALPHGTQTGEAAREEFLIE